jgi:long-chain acyl-CoA synthetase
MIYLSNFSIAKRWCSMPPLLKQQTLIDALLHWSEKTPDKIFIHSGRDSFSFADTRVAAARLAGFLAQRNISAGARICLLLPRTPELLFSFLAANLIGCLPAPVNYLESLENISKTVEAIEPAVIIADATVLKDDLLEFIEKYGALFIMVNSRDQTGARGFLRWEHCAQHSPLPFLPAVALDSLAYLNFTTGSTGLPKGALCTHANLYWNTRSAIEIFHLTEADVHLCMFASFAHPHELFCRALHTGGSLALLTEISPKAVVRAVNQHQITCMMGLAVMYKMMAEHCAGTALPSLRIAESGGMYTPPELQRDFFAAFQVPLLSVWGSTETTGIALANSPAHRRADGSAGRVCPYYQVKLADEEGRAVATGEIGELLFSGPGVVSGYYQDSSSFPMQDGWYRSGDLAWQDGDGFYHFAERKSGMIKVAGLKVYPLQIELVLQQHPGVREAAVIGVEEKRHGCVPKAFVAAKEGVRLDADDLTLFCRERLAAYMVPKQFHFIKTLPKIGSGKIHKKALLHLHNLGDAA